MVDVVGQDQMVARNKLVSVLAAYKRVEDLINIGAYVDGSNPEIDYAVKKLPEINAFLRQGMDDKVNYSECLVRLKSLFH
jgi:flagellum-specific ATP synthase